MSAVELRDAGIQAVDNPTWTEQAMNKFVKTTSLPPEFTGEDIRLALTSIGLAPPHHHNAWGAFTMNLVRSGRIKPTGQFKNMKTEKSHARITRVYTRA